MGEDRPDHKKISSSEPSEKNGDTEVSVQVNDKRHWVRKDWNPQERSSSRLPNFLENLKKQIRESEKQVQQVREAARQLRDESDSYRKRLERDLDRKIDHAQEKFFKDMLEVLDNLERSVEIIREEMANVSESATWSSLVDGLEMVCKLFLDKLAGHGVKKLNVLNQTFNPETAEALDVLQIEEPEKDNTILEVYQDGFSFKDRTLRPARVSVGKLMKSKPKTDSVEGDAEKDSSENESQTEQGTLVE